MVDVPVVGGTITGGVVAGGGVTGVPVAVVVVAPVPEVLPAGAAELETGVAGFSSPSPQPARARPVASNNKGNSGWRFASRK